MKKILFPGILVLLLIPAFLCGGCYDVQFFENTAVIIYAGADKGSGDQLALSFAVAESEASGQILTLLRTEAPLMASAITKLNAENEDILRAGKIQNLIFSEELAKEGILKLKDGNSVSEANRFMADYAITKGTAAELFTVLQKKEAENGSYGYFGELLSNAAAAGLCPDTRLHEFNIDVAAEGIDPMLPLVDYDTEAETVSVIGTALLQNDRMVTALDTEDSRYLALLSGSGKHTVLPLMGIQPETGYLSLHITKSKNKIKLQTKGDRLKICFALTVDGHFDVGDWAEIKPQYKKTAVAELEKQIGNRCMEVLSKLQAAPSDPFGVASKLRGYHNQFYRTHDFTEVYQNAAVEVTVNMRLLNQKY